MAIESLVVIVAALLLGTIGKAITGFGLPLLAVPVMAVFIDVQTAVVVMTLPATVSNVWLLWEFRKSAASIPGLAPAIIAGLAGIVVGAWLLKTLDPAIMALALSAWIGVYLVTQIGGRELPRAFTDSRAAFAGMVGLGGICQGATGIAGPIIVTYMHAMKIDRNVLVFGLSAVFLAYGIGQAVIYVSLGLVNEARLIQSTVAMVPVFVGMPIGLWLGRRINAKTFQVCVIALLLVSGAKLFWDGLAAFS